MAATKPTVFVISPIGQKNTPQRKQADDILDFVKDVTREAYDVMRGDEQSNSRIADTILDSLQRYPIVVAYLGSGENGNGWNPNVMFEVGYRLATGKPLVLLAHEDRPVPFDLNDFRHVGVPSADKLPYDEKLSAQQYSNAGQALLSAIQRQARRGTLASPFAVADAFVDTTPERPEDECVQNSIFLRASDKANRLFHTPTLFKEDGPSATLVGKQLTTVDQRLKDLIDDNQWKKFAEEQEALFGRLLLKKPNIEATIPFVFKDAECVDKVFRGRAFLPLITDYEFKENGLALRILYLEVPSTLCHTGEILRVEPSDSRALLGALKAGSGSLSSVSDRSQPGAKDGTALAA